MSTLKAIKSSFEMSYDKQNITLGHFIENLSNEPSYEMTTCVISSIYRKSSVVRRRLKKLIEENKVEEKVHEVENVINNSV